MRARTLSNVFTAVAASSLVAATPTLHNHHHHHPRHVEARVAENVKVVNIAGPTQIVYEFNGSPIEEEEVCRGIQDGSLKWAAGTETPPKCPVSGSPEFLQQSSFTSLQVPTATLATLPSFAAVSTSSNPKITLQAPASTIAGVRTSDETSTVQAPTSSEHRQPLNQSKTADATPIAQPTMSIAASDPTLSKLVPSISSYNIPGSQGLDRDFDDGDLDCSTFPSAYGPIKVDWAGLDGWSGVQYVTIQGNAITHIDTAVPSQSGSKCKPGAMCSYACPPGFQKSQWPSAQGKTGQSVGGLQCDANGKLRLTNPNLSKKLCIPGTGATVVQNELSDNAAICRTDYPGTENEVVPLNTQPGTTSPLTCPDAKTYFKWTGSSTTAQYYINNQGVPLDKACIWGSDGTNMGNWAPSYLGVGRDIYGKTFLAIASTAQNSPTNYKPLNYSIEIVGNLSGRCKLSQGRYCSGPTYDDCNDDGCTVELLSGRGTYVLSD